MKPQIPACLGEGHLLAGADQGDGVAAQVGGSAVQHRFGGVLRQIDPAEPVGLIGAGRVQQQAGEGDDVARRDLEGQGALIVGPADQVVGSGGVVRLKPQSESGRGIGSGGAKIIEQNQ